MRFKKKNYVAQVDTRDCGVACLAMILRHYGSDYSLASLREKAKTSLEGTSALALVKVAEELGMEARAFKADSKIFETKEIHYPFIAHVVKKGQLLHYYLVLGLAGDMVVLADPDPTVGLVKMKRSVFEEEWTGVCIFLAPSPAYEPRREEKAGLWAFLPILGLQKGLIAHIVIAAFLVTLINMIGSYYLQSLIDSYIPDHMKTSLGTISLALMVVYILQQFLVYGQDYLLLVLGQRLSIDLILGYIKHIFQLPMSFFSTRRTGEIVSRFLDANSIIDALASSILSIFLDMTMLVFISFVLFSQARQLFFLTLLIIPIYALLILAFVKPFERLNQASMQASSHLSSSIIEDINGIETIKSLGVEGKRYQVLDRDFVRFLKKTFRQHQAESQQKVLKKLAQLLLNLGVLCYGANLVMDGQMSLGQLITYNALLVYFTNPLESMIQLQTKLQAAKVANNRLNEVYLVESEFSEDKVISDLTYLKGDLIIENLSYKYGFGRDILSHIHLKIKKGSKTAFVGMSGSGKSTLAKLLVSFYQPSQGTIRMGEIPLNQIDPKALRKSIHYLPQEAYVFQGTILENLLLGVEGEVSQEKLLWAVELAAIKEDIEKMPQNYQTELSADATALSGGQKQRLALARALLADADVYILDEATSSLDVLTEKRIIDGLLALDKTIIFIAHRLSIAEKVDQVFVFDQGKIVEEGRHEKLLAQKGLYYDLVRN